MRLVLIALARPRHRACGHVTVARAFLRHPTDLAAHWAWLPGRYAVVGALAALAWTVAPLPNLLATPAPTETSFTLLVLASA
ncbi:hypothetical protein WMF04_35075 [Sorangium sp. So ce260]|uniref:hypothetical protein n=1 Tax=Sorangium sp. So ce260 TaxID=3133291 RepID=UPI003F634AC5